MIRRFITTTEVNPTDGYYIRSQASLQRLISSLEANLVGV